jgi:hypothetical protein
MIVENYLLTSNTTFNWTVPPNIYQILVELQADGQDGFAGNYGDDDCNGSPGGDGGTAGGYAASILNVTPGQIFTVTYNIGVTLEFGSPSLQASSGLLGGGASGQFTYTGQPGWLGSPGGVGNCAMGWASGGMGGTGGDSYLGGGGSGGIGSTYGGGNGLPGNLGGGGGGGGSGGDPGGGFGSGGVGGPALLRISYWSAYGYLGDTHQTHNTGQTSGPIKHCTPLNKYTSTKGVGMRRKWILAAALADASNVRVTQEYAEVFNVDPPTPEIRITQQYVEILEAPPGPSGFNAARTRRLYLLAAALAPQQQPQPYNPQQFMRWVMLGAALAASLPPEPPDPCEVCTGGYRVRVRGVLVDGAFIKEEQVLIETRPAICNCP